MIEYKLQFYTLKEIPTDLRGTFSLDSNPYLDEKALDFLKPYGIFFYRDEFHPHGILMNPEEGDITKQFGFEAFRYIVKMETDNKSFCRVGKWASGMTQKTFKDKWAWLEFGRKRTIMAVSKQSVKWM